MKKILFLIYLLPISMFGQVYIPTHYDAAHTAEHILHGHLKMYCADKVEFVVEKKKDVRFVRDKIDVAQAAKRLQKEFAKGNAEFVRQTDGGYWFTIAIMHPKDETVIIGYAVFKVERYTQKIYQIEILKGE